VVGFPREQIVSHLDFVGQHVRLCSLRAQKHVATVAKGGGEL
jgi:hypothetical protein